MSWFNKWFGTRTFGAARSPKWSEVRAKHLKDHPLCAVCEKKGGLLTPNNVHHKLPFHLHPELELDPKNLITLCREDHYLFGHFNNWSSFNKDIEEDSQIWDNKIKTRP